MRERERTYFAAIDEGGGGGEMDVVFWMRGAHSGE
jgi:hypothetical protein